MHLAFALLLFGCPLEISPAPSASVETGECQGDDTDSARMAVAEPLGPSVVIDTDGAEVVVDYLAMDANCCPSPQAEVEVAADAVSVNLEDVSFDDPCDCTCVTDFRVEVADLEPGTWTVTARYRGEVLGTKVVEL